MANALGSFGIRRTANAEHLRDAAHQRDDHRIAGSRREHGPAQLQRLDTNPENQHRAKRMRGCTCISRTLAVPTRQLPCYQPCPGDEACPQCRLIPLAKLAQLARLVPQAVVYKLRTRYRSRRTAAYE